ncbi:MAG: hypothetical protein IT356_11230 [Gemmatimonadaceae bacterium]|nr:hypothetical protein [Gemmatimonadaceae bacterium]
MRTLLVAVALLSAVRIGTAQTAAHPASAQAPENDCLLQFRGVVVNGVVTTHVLSVPASPGRSNYFVGGGVDAFCANSDQRVTADSAEQYGDQRLVYLIGRVRYTEQRVELNADRVTYFMGDERLVAEGSVHGRTSTGTVFSGPQATYLRAKPGLRARSRLDAGGRPDIWISPADAGSATPAGDSTHVVADSIISDNDSLVYAISKVILRRPDLVGTADSMLVDQGREAIALRRAPRLSGTGSDPYELDGEKIDIHSRNRQADRVRSSGKGRARNGSVTLTADSIELQLADRRLVRSVAWGIGRALARQPGREIHADSIDVEMPAQVLRSITAIGRARAESVPDSAKISSRDRDWLAGDTIIATFDSLAAPDSAASIRTVTASGAAQSWQQSARDRVSLPDSMPVVNYVTGLVIVADFNPDRSLDRVRVHGQVSGLIVQPADSARKPASSAKRPPPMRR